MLKLYFNVGVTLLQRREEEKRQLEEKKKQIEAEKRRQEEEDRRRRQVGSNNNRTELKELEMLHKTGSRARGKNITRGTSFVLVT